MTRLQRMPDRLGAVPSRLAGSVKPVDPFYHSAEWRALASSCKRARAFRCEGCGADHSATVWKLRADHITAIKDGGEPLDPLNVQVLCPTCDNRKRAQEHRQRGAGRGI